MLITKYYAHQNLSNNSGVIQMASQELLLHPFSHLQHSLDMVQLYTFYLLLQ